MFIFMKIKVQSYIIAILLLSCLCLSCRNATDDITIRNKVAVRINLLGVTGSGNIPDNRTGLVSAAYIGEVAYNKDYNVVATVIPEVYSVRENAGTSFNPSAWTFTPQPSTINAIEAKVKYLVMIFDENGNRIIAEERVYDSSSQSDKANQMTLDAGKRYTFVAVSYNTATAPAFNALAMTLNDVNNTIAVDHTTDYLYFNSGAMNIVYGEQNYINIIFKHINSRVALSIDATAEMGNVTNISANISGIGSVNLAANGSTTSGTSAAYNKDFTFPVLNKQVVVSSPILISSAGHQHTINIVSASLNNTTARTDIPPIIVPAGTFQKGVSYKVDLSFQATGILAGGLIWARGNLAYDWVNKIYYNRYYPQETGHNYKDTDYWNYATNQSNPLVPKMIIPSHGDIWNSSSNVYYFTDGTNENSTTKTLLNDPCKMVAGAKWRMPSLNDFLNLGIYKVHNGNDVRGITDGLQNTSFDGGMHQANGDIINNFFPYVYFEGTNEIYGGAVRLRFYKSGRYYGNVTEADRALGYQNGGNLPYIQDAAIYMASDAYNYEGSSLYRRPFMPVIYNGDRSNGSNTFITKRKDYYADWSADDRVSVRCVKNP
ncbi:hypothetical protein LX74_02692 [Elizabethkingia miricola]|uniref:Fimbrillin family protein n=2 Tax=Elizabethkingia miricola TaxID=172045 RepID=A0ABY3NE50_ELIMR|nr:hypothetical protein LX74_02692 [Elizabethkingia miricola]